MLQAHAEEGTYLPPVADQTVAKECGACHMVFPPQLLPARSWQKLMADLSSHFGEDASLADPARARLWPIWSPMPPTARRRGTASASCAGLSAADTPLRISATPFWQRAHDELSAAHSPAHRSSRPPIAPPVTRPQTGAISPSLSKEDPVQSLIGHWCDAAAHGTGVGSVCPRLPLDLGDRLRRGLPVRRRLPGALSSWWPANEFAGTIAHSAQAIRQHE